MEAKWWRRCVYAVLVLAFLLVATGVFVVGRRAWLDVMDPDYRAIRPVGVLRYWHGRREVVKYLGSPDRVVHSLADMNDYPYPKIPEPVREEVLVYHRYPWGIFIYVHDKPPHRVTGIVLIRCP